jgi:hypothetical protein
MSDGTVAVNVRAWSAPVLVLRRIFIATCHCGIAEWKIVTLVKNID